MAIEVLRDIIQEAVMRAFPDLGANKLKTRKIKKVKKIRAGIMAVDCDPPCKASGMVSVRSMHIGPSTPDP